MSTYIHTNLRRQLFRFQDLCCAKAPNKSPPFTMLSTCCSKPCAETQVPTLNRSGAGLGFAGGTCLYRNVLWKMLSS